MISLYTADYVVTQNDARDILEKAAVAVEDGKILSVGHTDLLEILFPDSRRVDLGKAAVAQDQIGQRLEPLVPFFVPGNAALNRFLHIIRIPPAQGLADAVFFVFLPVRDPIPYRNTAADHVGPGGLADIVDLHQSHVAKAGKFGKRVQLPLDPGSLPFVLKHPFPGVPVG